MTLVWMLVPVALSAAVLSVQAMAALLRVGPAELRVLRSRAVDEAGVLVLCFGALHADVYGTAATPARGVCAPGSTGAPRSTR